MQNAQGTSHADIVFKQHICESVLRSRGQLWSCRQVGRARKLQLMHRVATSSFSWCVGAWTVTQRSLSKLAAQFNRTARVASRIRRYFGESDEAYHRRSAKELRKYMGDAKLNDLHAHVLGRMYDYTGHFVRATQRDPRHLTGQVLHFRGAAWKRQMMEMVGHQGHPGRFAPWNWERQYDHFFDQRGALWTDVATNKPVWNSYREAWIDHMLGSRVARAIRMPRADV